MARFFNTNAFRLAALYFALFAGSVLALFAFFYLSTAGFIETQIEQTVGAEIRGLQEQYEQLGEAGLVALVRERSLNERVDNMIYVMTDPFLHQIAGNLSAWPRRITPVKPGWITFPFEVHTRTDTEVHTALGTQLIVGGDRLLVARDLRDATVFRQHVLSTIAWAALISLGLGIIGGLLMTRQMLRRVETVANTTRHIIHGDQDDFAPVEVAEKLAEETVTRRPPAARACWRKAWAIRAGVRARPLHPLVRLNDTFLRRRRGNSNLIARILPHRFAKISQRIRPFLGPGDVDGVKVIGPSIVGFACQPLRRRRGNYATP